MGLEPLLDFAVLETLADMIGAEQTEQLMAMLSLELSDKPRHIRELIDRNDQHEARRQAHRLKGASAGVGAVRVTGDAERLEIGSDVDLPALAARLQATAVDTIAAIAAWSIRQSASVPF